MRTKWQYSFACIALAACQNNSSNFTGSYVGGDQSALIQLELVDSGDNKLAGSIAVSQLDFEAGKVKTTVKHISGVKDGKKISLTAHRSEWGASDAALSMEIKDKSIVWKIPSNGLTIDLQPANQTEYRRQLTKFENQLHGTDAASHDNSWSG